MTVTTTPAAEPLLAQLSFLEAHRCFAKGRTLKFRPGVNLLVGEQGCGKSTVLGLVKAMASPRESERSAAQKTVKLVTRNAKMVFFDFEHDNPRTLSHFDDRNIMFQLSSQRSSHGETVRAMLNAFAADFANAQHPTVVLLDEPDMALSPRSAHQLARQLQDIAAAGHQVLAAVHNPILIASQPNVFSLEHGRWLKSKTFLDKHAEAA